MDWCKTDAGSLMPMLDQLIFFSHGINVLIHFHNVGLYRDEFEFEELLFGEMDMCKPFNDIKETDNYNTISTILLNYFLFHFFNIDQAFWMK